MNPDGPLSAFPSVQNKLNRQESENSDENQNSDANRWRQGIDLAYHIFQLWLGMNAGLKIFGKG